MAEVAEEASYVPHHAKKIAFIFSAISVVMPPRWPVSTSTFSPHSFSVCGVQPIFAESDTIAAQRLLCCPSPFKTIRTASSRTSGVYLFVVLFMMLHPTHEAEPPAKRGWLTLMLWHDAGNGLFIGKVGFHGQTNLKKGSLFANPLVSRAQLDAMLTSQ